MAACRICRIFCGVDEGRDAAVIPRHSSVWSEGCSAYIGSVFFEQFAECLEAHQVTSRKPQRLASSPTITPESAGLCALGLLGNLIRVTDGQ